MKVVRTSAPIQRCKVTGHDHDLVYLYTNVPGGLLRDLPVYQCPIAGFRFMIGELSQKRSPRPANGWAPVKLEDGKIVTDAGKVSDDISTKEIQDTDPWPADAAKEYSKPTRFRGYTAEQMGF
jgi:hypothetical protein